MPRSAARPAPPSCTSGSYACGAAAAYPTGCTVRDRWRREVVEWWVSGADCGVSKGWNGCEGGPGNASFVLPSSADLFIHKVVVVLSVRVPAPVGVPTAQPLTVCVAPRRCTYALRSRTTPRRTSASRHHPPSPSTATTRDARRIGRSLRRVREGGGRNGESEGMLARCMSGT